MNVEELLSLDVYPITLTFHFLRQKYSYCHEHVSTKPDYFLFYLKRSLKELYFPVDVVINENSRTILCQ